MEPEKNRLGVVVRGSLSRGLELRLDPEVPLESLRAGMFAVAGGTRFDFLSLVTDLELAASSDAVLDAPAPEPGSLLREVLSGESLHARASLRPHLMVDREPRDPKEALLPVKTIPGHFAEVRRATAEDVNRVFGGQDGQRFHIGSPMEMEEIELCINLDRFTERSNGIFGKTGTGKTFLTRLVLCGLVQKSSAVNLVFDMHGEYGWKGSDESRRREGTKGLKQLFDDRVQVFSLDPHPIARSDWSVRLPYSFLEPEDILSLHRVLSLTPTAAENSYLLERHFGRAWFARSLEMDPREVADEMHAHEGAVAALQRRLKRLAHECREFLRPDEDAGTDAVDRIIRNLSSGIHTVIDFGRFSRLTHYLLVANVLTRRIDERWRELTERAQHDGGAAPPRVVITIEEAHKFLEPGIADQTIFGRIARELRKYNVTLLIVDQRPSQIEREVLSQLGTKICCLLDDESDVDAVLAGTSGSAGLRSVLASLDTRQQALLFGHALPMPVVVKTRSYNEEFWASLGVRSPQERREQALEDRRKLWE